MKRFILKTLAASLLMLLALPPLAKSQDYVTSITSGNYYRIVSAYSGLNGTKVAMYADNDGMKYKEFSDADDANDGSFIFQITSNGTFAGYNAYNIKCISNDLYISRASDQWTGGGYTTSATTNTNFLISTSSSSWNECIIPMGTNGHGDASYTSQFLIQPAHNTTGTLQQCASLNGSTATSGNVRMNAWSDDGNAEYENSLRAWSFEPVDNAIAEAIIAANDPLITAINNLSNARESLLSSDNPGYYVRTNVEAFKKLFDQDKALAGSEAYSSYSTSQKQELATALTAAYSKATSEKNPIKNGYYRIVNANPSYTDRVCLSISSSTDENVGWSIYKAVTSASTTDEKKAAATQVFKVEDLNKTNTADNLNGELYSFQCIANNLYAGPGANDNGIECNENVYSTAYPVEPKFADIAGQVLIFPVRVKNQSGEIGQCIAPDNSTNSGKIYLGAWHSAKQSGNNDASWTFEPVSNGDVKDLLEAVLDGTNNLATVLSSTSITGQNIINNGTCESLVLTDGASFAPAESFTATSATYTRNMSNRWATICLPFAVNATVAVKLYKVSKINDGTITVESTESLVAGEPALAYKVDESATSITLTGSGSVVTAPITDQSLVGTFIQSNTIGSTDHPNAYYIKDNQFNSINESFTLNAFRAYLENGNAANTSSKFSIVVDDDPTGIASAGASVSDEQIEAVYSVSGVKTDDLKKGINIVRYRSGKTQKVILK